MPKAFTKRENELIKNRLVEQGYKQFSAYGLKKTNVEEIAKVAGISKGAFYNFYESKEDLFMDVAELAEQRFRQEIFAVIDLTGPSPRARLSAVFKKAFDLLKTIPLLQSITGSDYDVLVRRVPAEKFREHMASDQKFFEDLIARCREAGIPIKVPAKEIGGLLYPLVVTGLQQNDLSPNYFSSSLDLLLELVAAYCLGEIEVPQQKAEQFASQTR
ncbi:MAG: TetR/AcrR family transcriptional regulator [Anaerolineaceae bacterium]|jgi:AcrR family transcriptional regulator